MGEDVGGIQQAELHQGLNVSPPGFSQHLKVTLVVGEGASRIVSGNLKPMPVGETFSFCQQLLGCDLLVDEDGVALCNQRHLDETVMRPIPFGDESVHIGYFLFQVAGVVRISRQAALDLLADNLAEADLMGGPGDLFESRVG